MYLHIFIVIFNLSRSLLLPVQTDFKRVEISIAGSELNHPRQQLHVSHDDVFLCESRGQYQPPGQYKQESYTAKKHALFVMFVVAFCILLPFKLHEMPKDKSF